MYIGKYTIHGFFGYDQPSATAFFTGIDTTGKADQIDDIWKSLDRRLFVDIWNPISLVKTQTLYKGNCTNHRKNRIGMSHIMLIHYLVRFRGRTTFLLKSLLRLLCLP